MGLFDRFKRATKKTEETEVKETTIDNLRVGGFIEVPLLTATGQASKHNNDTMQITSEAFLKSDSLNINFVALDSGDLFACKSGMKIEFMKEIQDLDSFIEVANTDELGAILELEDGEVKTDENGKEYVDSLESIFHLNEDISMLKSGKYHVIKDELYAEFALYDGEEIRVVRAKNNDENFITFVLRDGGETIVFESKVVNPLECNFL